MTVTMAARVGILRFGGDVQEASGVNTGYRREGEGGHEIILFR